MRGCGKAYKLYLWDVSLFRALTTLFILGFHAIPRDTKDNRHSSHVGVPNKRNNDVRWKPAIALLRWSSLLLVDEGSSRFSLQIWWLTSKCLWWSVLYSLFISDILSSCLLTVQWKIQNKSPTTLVTVTCNLKKAIMFREKYNTIFFVTLHLFLILMQTKENVTKSSWILGTNKI